MISSEMTNHVTEMQSQRVKFESTFPFQVYFMNSYHHPKEDNENSLSIEERASGGMLQYLENNNNNDKVGLFLDFFSLCCDGKENK